MGKQRESFWRPVTWFGDNTLVKEQVNEGGAQGFKELGRVRVVRADDRDKADSAP